MFVNEKNVVGTVELKEGTTVDILKVLGSKNCYIRYVSKILSKNRYNSLN